MDSDSKYPLKVLYCGGTVQFFFVPFSIVRALFLFVFTMKISVSPQCARCLQRQVQIVKTNVYNKHVNSKVRGLPWKASTHFILLCAQYCEYMPEPAKCRQWLEKNFPDVFARMTVGESHIRWKPCTVHAHLLLMLHISAKYRAQWYVVIMSIHFNPW